MRYGWLALGSALLTAACSSEDKGTSVHCFDERLTLPAFVQTNCPTINPTTNNTTNNTPATPTP